MQGIYARISIQVTMQSIREKLERGELLKIPNASGKAAFWQSFVCIDICGHDGVVVVMLGAYNKSLPLSSVCVCVFVYSRDSTHQRA